jgi:hypothetical protein
MYTLQAKGREMNQFFTMAVTSSELAFLYTQYISLDLGVRSNGTPQAPQHRRPLCAAVSDWL